MHLGMTGRFHVQARGDNRAAPARRLRIRHRYRRRRQARARRLRDAGRRARDLFRSAPVRLHAADPRDRVRRASRPDARPWRRAAVARISPPPISRAARPDGETDLKAFLMDQRNVAGLGNIYVLEALHVARLKPSRSAACARDPDRQTNASCRALGRRHPPGADGCGRRRAGRRCAIIGRPTAARDRSKRPFRVYGRAGEPCLTPGCRGTVRRSIQGGRSSFFCPVCQH